MNTRQTSIGAPCEGFHHQDFRSHFRMQPTMTKDPWIPYKGHTKDSWIPYEGRTKGLNELWLGSGFCCPCVLFLVKNMAPWCLATANERQINAKCNILNIENNRHHSNILGSAEDEYLNENYSRWFKYSERVIPCCIDVSRSNQDLHHLCHLYDRLALSKGTNNKVTKTTWESCVLHLQPDSAVTHPSDVAINMSGK